MSDRLTKKQLKEDPLLKSTGDTIDFARHHVRLLVGIIGAGLLLVVIVVFARNSSARAENGAAAALIDARTEMARGALDLAGKRLENIINTQGGTTSGRQAKLILGDLRFREGRYQESADAYEEALQSYADDPILGPVARRGLAAARENLGQYEKASQLFQELADTATSGSLRAELLLAVARNHLQAGKQAEARTLYQELSENPDNYSVAQQAGLRLAELGG